MCRTVSFEAFVTSHCRFWCSREKCHISVHRMRLFHVKHLSQPCISAVNISFFKYNHLNWLNRQNTVLMNHLMMMMMIDDEINYKPLSQNDFFLLSPVFSYVWQMRLGCHNASRNHCWQPLLHVLPIYLSCSLSANHCLTKAKINNNFIYMYLFIYISFIMLLCPSWEDYRDHVMVRPSSQACFLLFLYV